MTRLEGYIRLMIAGDPVAWIGTAVVFLLLLPILIAWWYFARKFKREEEEKRNRWKKTK